MADKGRCAGCGLIGSLRAARIHVLGCAAYAKTARAGGLVDPAEDYARHRAATDSPAARAAAREQRLRRRYADTQARGGQRRWHTGADILDE